MNSQILGRAKRKLLSESPSNSKESKSKRSTPMAAAGAGDSMGPCKVNIVVISTAEFVTGFLI